MESYLSSWMKTQTWVVLSLILLQLCSLARECNGSINSTQVSHEARLKAYLKSRAEAYGGSRPLLNTSQTITVNFGLRLIQVSLDEKANLLTTSVWIRQRWYDEYLTWDVDDYGGLSRIGIPSDWVWTPDVTLVNTGSTDDDARRGDVRVDFDGSIFWLLHRVYRSACLVHLRDYPYDQQTCHLWFQSFSHPSDDLDLQPYRVAFDLDTYLSDFQQADEWEIVSNRSVRVRSPRELGELLMFSQRVTLRKSLTLRRRVGFQAYILCVPCVVFGAMSALVFLLPPERPDRHAIATTLLGSFVLLLLILVQTAPPSAASIPQLGLLYAANIAVIVVSLALSSIVVNVSKRGDSVAPFPAALEKVTRVLAKAFCVPCPPTQKSDQLLKSSSPTNGTEIPLDEIPVTLSNKDGSVTGHLQSIEIKMARIEGALYRLYNAMTTPRKGGSQDGPKWKTLAGVLDKIFLMLQCTLIVTTACVLFPKAHY